MRRRRRQNIFDLFDDFRREMDRIFEEFMTPELESPMYNVQRRELHPLTQITETEAEVIVSIDLPYVRREDIKINATEEKLSIEAPLRECVTFDCLGSLQKKTQFDAFRKTITLPAKVEPTRAKARFKEGLLEIRLPKKVEGKEISIE